MDAVPTQVVNVDQQEKDHVEAIAKEVGFAMDKKTGLLEVQPAAEQHPLTEESQKTVESLGEENTDKPSKLKYFLPTFKKTVYTSKAMNFLGKKMEWLHRKSGDEVQLK